MERQIQTGLNSQTYFSGFMRYLVTLFIQVHYLFNSIGVKLHGLGYVQKLLKKEFVFSFLGKKVQYLPSIKGSYDYMLIGKSNEPETQLFLSRVIPKLNTANFINVGASVGEFVVSACNYSNVQNVFAYEPRTECTSMLRKYAELNNEKRLMVFENAVSNTKGLIEFNLNTGGTSSGLFGNSETESGPVPVKAVTLDSTLPQVLENPIMLIDVEGAEKLVITGGMSFIRQNRPLIIFEYNQTSKKHFNLEEIVSLLGKTYEIYRLRGDGNLDSDFSITWNCVAVPRLSVFHGILQSSVKQLL